MLVLSRREGERLILRDQRGLEVVVSIERVNGASVRVGVSAPRNIEIIREELPRELMYIARGAAFRYWTLASEESTHAQV